MTDFNTLQDIWQQQSPVQKQEPGSIIEKAIREQLQLKLRQRSTMLILLATTAVLIGYFVFYLRLCSTAIKVSAALMIGSMLFRVWLEMISHWQLDQIDFKQSLKAYAHQFTRFYVFRNRINFFFTPLTMLLYSLGFTYLLPSLKANTSNGWYIYIIISGILFLVGFSVFLFWNIRREMKMLKQMKEVEMSISEH